MCPGRARQEDLCHTTPGGWRWLAAVLGFLPHRPAGQRDPSLPAGEAWVPLSRAAKGPALNGGRARAWEVACGGDLLDWKTGDGPDALGWAGLWEDSCLVSRSLAEGPGKSPGFRAPAPPPHDCPPARPCGCGSKELDSRAGPRRSNGEPQQDRSAVWGGGRVHIRLREAGSGLWTAAGPPGARGARLGSL